MLLVQIDICHMCKTHTLEFKDSVQRNVEYFNHFLCYLHAEIINTWDMELNQNIFTLVSFISFHLFLMWQQEYLILLVYLGGASGKEPICQCARHRRRGFNPWVGKIPWSRACKPSPDSRLENCMNRGAWRATVHGEAKSDISRGP